MTKLINWKAIYKNKAIFHIYFTARKRGKSDTKGWSFLEAITKDNNYRFAWIRRRWHDSLLSTKPFFEDLVHKFCEENNKNLNHFEIRERGLSYQGAKRIDFYDLFSYQRARGAIARTVYQEIVFEEAIPIDQEFLYVGGRTEQWMFKDLIDSLKGRKGKDGKTLPLQTKITANPYLFSAWFLDVFQNIHKLRKLAEEKKAKNNTKQTDSTLVNFCFDWEEVAKSKLKNCRLRKKDELVRKWVKLLKEGMLFFRDYRGEGLIFGTN